MDSSVCRKTKSSFYVCVIIFQMQSTTYLTIPSLRTELWPTRFEARKFQLRCEAQDLKTFCVPVCNPPILNPVAANSRYSKADSAQSDPVGPIDVIVVPRFIGLTEQAVAHHLPYPEPLQSTTTTYIYPGYTAILFSRWKLGFPNGFFPSDFGTKNV
jgi:hypothetical protein